MRSSGYDFKSYSKYYTDVVLTPPMFYAYIFFIIASILLMGAALSRKSFGFTLMYIIYLGIDGIGFLKTLL